jgi:hypothetical protein
LPDLAVTHWTNNRIAELPEEVDDQFKRCRLLDREFGRLGALKNLVDVASEPAEYEFELAKSVTPAFARAGETPPRRCRPGDRVIRESGCSGR